MKIKKNKHRFAHRHDPLQEQQQKEQAHAKAKQAVVPHTHETQVMEHDRIEERFKKRQDGGRHHY